MANIHNNNERRYQRYPMDKYYMADSGQLYELPILQGIKERQMIAKIIIWAWYFPGLPALVVSFCAFVFNWIHIGDVKEFITIMIAAITGISKVIIMWAEKGDIVRDKWRKMWKGKLKP